MYRQLYQMGGIGTLPMDYGQSLQVPQQPQSMFTPTGSATSSPLLNYGQSQLGQAGGTPLTMRSGGMSRLGYQEGGMGMTQLGAPQEEPIFPRLETLNENLGQAEQRLGSPSNNQFNISPMTSAFSGRPQMNLGGRIGYQEGGMGMDQMMQPQMQDPMMQDPAMMQDQTMMQPQMQQAPQIDPSQMDPKQALEIIIQMLIAQGIPPEQAREIALQMVQAVAEGGMGEMEDQRVEARFGGRIGYASGGIGSLVNRQGYFLGDIVKGVGKIFKGAVNAVKKVVKSDLGKAALTVAAIYASGGGFSPEGFSLFGTQGSTAGGLLGAGGEFGLGQSYLGQTLLGTAGAAPTQGLFGAAGVFKPSVGSLIPTGISSLLPSSSTLTTLGIGTSLGKIFGGEPRREDYGSDEEHQAAVARYKTQFQTAMNNPNPQFAAGLYPNNPFYPQRQVTAMAANGGRIGYAGGGIGDLISQVTKQEYFGTPMMANGGRMNYALGAEVPTRQNQAGVTELDYRDTGGFVPPIGIKERADDIPAMLSNNEFVFTADAVRNAGGGDENIGAQRMYKLMKNLEAGGSV
jgi:hypothetical protein